jgi:hypothetical protein
VGHIVDHIVGIVIILREVVFVEVVDEVHSTLHITFLLKFRGMMDSRVRL